VWGGGIGFQWFVCVCVCGGGGGLCYAEEWAGVGALVFNAEGVPNVFLMCS